MHYILLKNQRDNIYSKCLQQLFLLFTTALWILISSRGCVSWSGRRRRSKLWEMHKNLSKLCYNNKGYIFWCFSRHEVKLTIQFLRQSLDTDEARGRRETSVADNLLRKVPQISLIMKHASQSCDELIRLNQPKVPWSLVQDEFLSDNRWNSRHCIELKEAVMGQLRNTSSLYCHVIFVGNR